MKLGSVHAIRLWSDPFYIPPSPSFHLLPLQPQPSFILNSWVLHKFGSSLCHDATTQNIIEILYLQYKCYFSPSLSNQYCAYFCRLTWEPAYQNCYKILEIWSRFMQKNQKLWHMLIMSQLGRHQISGMVVEQVDVQVPSSSSPSCRWSRCLCSLHHTNINPHSIQYVAIYQTLPLGSKRFHFFSK